LRTLSADCPKLMSLAAIRYRRGPLPQLLKRFMQQGTERVERAVD
jgi:hypothetical protein